MAGVCLREVPEMAKLGRKLTKKLLKWRRAAPSWRDVSSCCWTTVYE